MQVSQPAERRAGAGLTFMRLLIALQVLTPELCPQTVHAPALIRPPIDDADV